MYSSYLNVKTFEYRLKILPVEFQDDVVWVDHIIRERNQTSF
jgi:hypothetical protein